ncbi:MAG: TIM-barrel domain-containing protein [Blautia sp.]
MITQKGNKIYRRQDKELLCIEPWGKNSFRVRATQRYEFVPEDISALLPPQECEVKVLEEDDCMVIENGKIRCEITPTGKLRFKNQDGKLLLEEFERIRADYRKEYNSALEIVPRTFEPHQNTDNFRLTVRFEPIDGEKLYGMGQYQQPYLDVKGCTLELAQRNSQASVPFVLSNNGYGFLWNNPAIGQVSFGKNVTEWTAVSTKQMDYWITAGDTPAEIEEAYADATGKVPMMPDYGTGFWQCKLRYMTQDEILEVAREYKRRKLPISVIVVDYFHWPNQGDWKFDTDFWPDPKAMVEELKEMGIELMVSIWPTVEETSENYKEMEELGYLTRSEHGKRLGQLNVASVIDVTNPDARKYVWEKIKKNYYDLGIKIFWLDEAEPELTGYEFSHYRYFRGADMEVGNMYPKEYARMAYEGMEEEGQENIVNLLRCAWAGSQKYGTLVWSGDIDSSFRSLRSQLAAGLNMGISGLPWWTTDIGGFHGGNINDEKFKEVLVRWFEFGAFCPVMRLHGFREPFIPGLSESGGGKHRSGSPNEVWTYGDEVLRICTKYLELRETIRPYVTELMKEAHEKGTPVMRPLFYDYPEDTKVWEIEDEYMFGPDMLVAPILYEDMRERTLYLPEGDWVDINSKTEYKGGDFVTVAAPLDTLPVFVKRGTHPELV